MTLERSCWTTTHPLPRGGTDLMTLERSCWTTTARYREVVLTS
jgi:hypothetical protein